MIIGAVAAISILLGVTAAEAVIPGAKGKLVACYAKSNGAVRIIDRSKRCKAREIRISWKRKGRIGARGPQGIQGPAGATGATGAGRS